MVPSTIQWDLVVFFLNKIFFFNKIFFSFFGGDLVF